MENMNSREYLGKCRAVILENLRFLEAAPSVAFQDVPPDWAVRDAQERIRESGGSLNPDVRPGMPGSGAGSSGIAIDGRREHPAEYYDGEKDNDSGGGGGGGGHAAKRSRLAPNVATIGEDQDDAMIKEASSSHQ
jgi:hypothetical protein